MESRKSNAAFWGSVDQNLGLFYFPGTPSVGCYMSSEVFLFSSHFSSFPLTNDDVQCRRDSETERQIAGKRDGEIEREHPCVSMACTYRTLEAYIFPCDFCNFRVRSGERLDRVIRKCSSSPIFACLVLSDCSDSKSGSLMHGTLPYPFPAQASLRSSLRNSAGHGWQSPLVSHCSSHYRNLAVTIKDDSGAWWPHQANLLSVSLFLAQFWASQLEAGTGTVLVLRPGHSFCVSLWLLITFGSVLSVYLPPEEFFDFPCAW